jgi:TetR/AcrR family transcriptional regulator, transcriptional repressor for nem operon
VAGRAVRKAAAQDDVLTASGLKKGGFYRHFADKETLALEAYRYALTELAMTRKAAVAGISDPLDALRALIASTYLVLKDFAVAGGCPLLNLAIESDDTDAVLRAEARKAMSAWRAELLAKLRAAAESGRLRADFDTRAFASFVLSAIEGAVAQSKLYGTRTHIDIAIQQLLALLAQAEVLTA